MRLRIACWLWIASFGVSLVCSPAQAIDEFAPTVDRTADFRARTLISGLDNPAGITLRATESTSGPYELFFAESGAGRILRVATNTIEDRSEVVTEFAMGSFGEQPGYRAGPLAIGFITRSKLAVTTSKTDGSAGRIACFALRDGAATLTAKQQDHAVGPIDQAIVSSAGEFDLCGLAVHEDVCFATTAGSNSHGWLLKCGVEANRLAYLEPLVDVAKQLRVGATGGITVIPEPRPSLLVTALMGSRETPQDCRLAFLLPTTGEAMMNLPLGLNDVIALAYSPSGQLYAADFSWHDKQAGGVYRIDDARIDGQQTCRAVKVASVVRPFGLVFAPNGSLFVTAFGEGENTKQGQLLEITGEL